MAAYGRHGGGGEHFARSDQAWNNWRRDQDYYDEGELLWLDADTLIRKTTNNQKSLNDFEHIFLGKGGNTGPLIVPYTFDELVADLNQVMPYDWATFLHDRVDKINPHADFAGIEQGGYKLVYKDQPSSSEKALADAFPKYFGGTTARRWWCRPTSPSRRRSRHCSPR